MGAQTGDGPAASAAPGVRSAAPAVRPVAPGVHVEVATWRPVEVVDVDGWLLGISGGFTRRANSVAALAEPADVEQALRSVEALCAARAVPARFRVDAQSLPFGLDAVLDERGYQVAATTHVLTRDMDGAVAGRGWPEASAVAGPAWPEAFETADQPDDDWIAGWLDVKANGSVGRDVARAVVTGSPASYLTARDGEGVVGVIRAGYCGSWVGLSCLMVPTRARRRGLARALTLAAMQVAGARGVSRAFLQVEAVNHPALALYDRLGFARADTYHYRER